jgi:CRISPR-associated protein Cas2
MARYRVVKVLLGYGSRVQKSVFEVPEIEPAAFLRMRSKIERHVDPATDSVRYYPLCGVCVGKVEHHGAGPGVFDEEEEPARVV